MVMFVPRRTFFAAVACSLMGAGVMAQTVDSPPPMEVGDKWTYRFTNTGDKREPYTYTNEVKAIDGTSTWIYGETNQPNSRFPKYVNRYDTKSAELVEILEFDPAAPNGAGKRRVDRQANDKSLQFPLSVGLTYTVKQKWDNGNGFTEYKAEVQAYEKVKVEAGEFDAFRIKYTGFWNNTRPQSYTGRAEWIRWYSPIAKNTVKSEYLDRQGNNQLWNQNVNELVKWEPAKR